MNKVKNEGKMTKNKATAEAECSIRKAVRSDIENKLHEIFPSTNYIPEKVINYAAQDVFETSALADGEDYYGDGDISLACERALLHYIGHPEY